MQRILLSLLLLASVFVPALSAQTKIGVVNMEIVLLAHPQTSENNKYLRDLGDKLEGEARKAEEAYKKAVDNFRGAEQQAREAQNTPIYTDLRKREAVDTLNQAAAAARNAEATYRRTLADMEKQIRKRQDECVGGVLQDINAELRKLAAEEGYAIVLDSSLERPVFPIPAVVYSTESVDLTDKLIARTRGDRATAEKALEESRKALEEMATRREAALNREANQE